MDNFFISIPLTKKLFPQSTIFLGIVQAKKELPKPAKERNYKMTLLSSLH